ncbi:MAG: nitroreductase family protein [Chloroflexota bacterium]
MSETIGLLEGMSTTRSIRRFTPDPIPDGLLRQVLEAATWAPSGTNAQNWRLLVVKDAEKRRRIGELYGEAFKQFYPADRLETETDPARKRLLGGAVYLAETMGTEPPVLVLFCRDNPTAGAPAAAAANARPWTRGSSVYPSVQNLLLAARAVGLGGCLTTIHLRYEDEIKALLDIPDDVDTYALVPLGYPRDRFGPLRRRPVEEVTHLDSWGEPLG